MKKALSFLSSIITVLGVSWAIAQDAPWRSTVKVSGSEFDKHWLLVGQTSTAGSIYGQPAQSWYLASTVNRKTGDLMHALTFLDFHQSDRPHGWRRADTDEAESLRVIVDRPEFRPRSRVYAEGARVTLGEDLLRRRVDRGLRIRLLGDGAVEAVLTIPAEQIRDQLEAAAHYRAAVNGAPSGPARQPALEAI